MSTLADLFDAGREEDADDGDFSYKRQTKRSKKTALPSLPAAADTLARIPVRLFRGADHVADAVAAIHTEPSAPASFTSLSLFAKDQTCIMSNAINASFFNTLIFEPSPPSAGFEAGPSHFSPTITFADISAGESDMAYYTLRFKGAQEKLSFAVVLAVAHMTAIHPVAEFIAAAVGGTAFTVDLGGNPIDAVGVAPTATAQVMVSSFALSLLPGLDAVGARVARALCPPDTVVKVDLTDLSDLPPYLPPHAARAIVGLPKGARRVVVAAPPLALPGAPSADALPVMGFAVHVVELVRVRKAAAAEPPVAPPPPPPPVMAAPAVSVDALFALLPTPSAHASATVTPTEPASAPFPGAAAAPPPPRGPTLLAVGGNTWAAAQLSALVSAGGAAALHGGMDNGAGVGGGGAGLNVGAAERLGERVDRLRYEVVDAARAVGDVRASVDGVTGAIAANHAATTVTLRAILAAVEGIREAGGGAADSALRVALVAAERERDALRASLDDVAARCAGLQADASAARAAQQRAEALADAAVAAQASGVGDDADLVVSLRRRVGELETQLEDAKAAVAASEAGRAADARAAERAAVTTALAVGGTDGGDVAVLRQELAAAQAAHAASIEEARVRDIDLRSAHAAELAALGRLNTQLEEKIRSVSVTAAAGVPVAEVVACLKDLASSSYYEFEDAVNSLPAETLSEAAAERILGLALPILRTRARASEAAIIAAHPSP